MPTEPEESWPTLSVISYFWFAFVRLCRSFHSFHLYDSVDASAVLGRGDVRVSVGEQSCVGQCRYRRHRSWALLWFVLRCSALVCFCIALLCYAFAWRCFTLLSLLCVQTPPPLPPRLLSTEGWPYGSICDALMFEAWNVYIYVYICKQSAGEDALRLLGGQSNDPWQ